MTTGPLPRKYSFISRTVCFISLAVLAACVPGVTTPTPITTPFDSTAIAFAAGEGSSSLVGQAFAKTRGGDTKYASGETVTLLPVSAYTTEYMQGIGTARGPATADPRLASYTRTTVADGEGRFTFRNIPSGQYHVYTKVFWEVPGQYVSSTTGSWIKDVVTVRGDTTNLILTPK
jgi:hypothetical protein